MSFCPLCAPRRAGVPSEALETGSGSPVCSPNPSGCSPSPPPAPPPVRALRAPRAPCLEGSFPDPSLPTASARHRTSPHLPSLHHLHLPCPQLPPSCPQRQGLSLPWMASPTPGLSSSSLPPCTGLPHSPLQQPPQRPAHVVSRLRPPTCPLPPAASLPCKGCDPRYGLPVSSQIHTPKPQRDGARGRGLRRCAGLAGVLATGSVPR